MADPWENDPIADPWEADPVVADGGPSIASDVASTIATTPNRWVSGAIAAPGDLGRLLLQSNKWAYTQYLKGLETVAPDKMKPYFQEGVRTMEDFASGPSYQPGYGYDVVSKTLDSPVLPKHEPETLPGQLTALGIDVAVPVGLEMSASRVPQATRMLRETTRRTGEVVQRPQTDMARRAEEMRTAGMEPNIPTVTQSEPAAVTANAMKMLPGSRISQRAQANRDVLLASRGASAERVGTPRTPDKMGEMFLADIESFRKSEIPATTLRAPTKASSFAGKQELLYDRIPVPASADASLEATRSALSELTSKFQSNPELAAAFQDSKIGRILNAVTPQRRIDTTSPVMGAQSVHEGGGLTWKELKALRSLIGEKIGSPSLNDTISTGEYRRLYSAITNDMRDTVQANGGRPALKAFDDANRYSKKGFARLDNALKKIFSVSKPEDAYNIAVRAARKDGGDIGRLRSLRQSVSNEVWNDFAASVIQNLGRPTAANQGVEGEAISAASFFKDYNSLSPQAKNLLFVTKEAKGLREKLDNLAKVSGYLKFVDRLENPSGSGKYFIAGGGGMAAASEPVTTSLLYGGGLVGARAMMSPKFVDFLISMSKKKAVTPTDIARLEKLAASEPAIAQDVLNLAEFYRNPSVRPLAAEEENGDVSQ